MDIINYLLPKIEHFRMLGYWLLLLITLLESLAFVGMLVPGTFLLVLFGSLAANGYFTLGDLVWFAALGAVLGDGGSFLLGKRGTGLFDDGNRIFKSTFLERGKAFFARHGSKSVFLGKFIPPVRALIPFIAGLSGMPDGRFYLWDVLSALLWAASHLYLGYLLGHAWRLIEVWSTRVGIFLAAVAIFLACGYYLQRFLVRKGRQLFSFVGSVLRSMERALAARPGFQEFVGRHPRLFASLHARLRSDRFSGLPLTLLGLAFTYILLLLLGVVEDVLTAESIVAVDTHLANLLYVYRDPDLVKVFLWITLIGKLQIVLSMTVIASLLLLVWHRKNFILPLWLTIGGSYLFDILGKVLLRRPRPVDIGVYREAFFSFPSGHATIATAFFGYLAYIFWRQTDNWRIRLNALFAAGTCILAIGFSRLYLGVHFFSDILGGILLGLLCLIIGICVRELGVGEALAHPAGAPRRGKAVLSTVLLLVAGAGFYLYSGVTYHPQWYFPAETNRTVLIYPDVLRGFVGSGLPKYTESLTGEKEEPLCLFIVAKNEGIVREAFRGSGWRQSDQVSLFTVTKTLTAFVFNENYPTAPVTPSFWNGTVNDLSFVKTTGQGSVRKRHEARLWMTPLQTQDGKIIYVGTASFSAIRKWWILPKIEPSLDRERDGLFNELLRGGRIASYGRYRFVPPLSGKNFIGDPFFTDGALYVITLK